jgi:hypothetical protein
MAARLPLLGFREWSVDGGVLVSAIRGERWTHRVLTATCATGHRAPADGCECGVYAVDIWPRLGDGRFYEHASGRARLLAEALLSAGVLAAWLTLILTERSLLSQGRWGGALAVAVAMTIALLGMLPGAVLLARPLAPYLMGAVLLSGRVLHYENGVLRAERARIACLIRPPGISRGLADSVAGRYGVPLFHWYERTQALIYLSEHGDRWPRPQGPRGRVPT